MRYLVVHGSREPVAVDSMDAALAVVRARIAGAAPYQAAMLEIEVRKVDARERVRRTVSGRELIALASGVPAAELFGYGYWRTLDDVVATGRNLRLEIAPDDGRDDGPWWDVVVRYDVEDADGQIVRRRARVWSALSIAEAEERLEEAAAYLAALPNASG